MTGPQGEFEPAAKLVRLTPEKPLQKEGVQRLELEPHAVECQEAKADEPELADTSFPTKLSFSAEPGHGQILYDKNGTPIAFEDGEGNLLGHKDANLPPLIEEILVAGVRKLPATAYELWQQQNPDGRAEDYLKLAAKGKIKPLVQQLEDAEKVGDTDAANAIRRTIRQGRN